MSIHRKLHQDILYTEIYKIWIDTFGGIQSWNIQFGIILIEKNFKIQKIT